MADGLGNGTMVASPRVAVDGGAVGGIEPGGVLGHVEDALQAAALKSSPSPRTAHTILFAFIAP